LPAEAMRDLYRQVITKNLGFLPCCEFRSLCFHAIICCYLFAEASIPEREQRKSL